MKIVINKKQGGFEVSREGIKWLLEYGADCIEPLDFVPRQYKNEQPRFYYHNDKWWGLKDEWDDCEIRQIRQDECLVQMVEELKDKASGQYSSLVVVEIPFGVEYIIQENHGYEWIAEKHRTWH